MEEKEHQPGAGVSEDPDSPVTVDLSAEDVATPAADSEESALPESEESSSEPVITNDPDAPVTVDVTDADLAPPDRDVEIPTADVEETVPPSASVAGTIPLATADPAEVDASEATPAAVETDDSSPGSDGDTLPPDSEAPPDPDADAPAQVDAGGSQQGDEELQTETAPVLTADPDESLFPPGSDEISPDQFLVGVEQPKQNDEIARRLAVLEAIIYVTDEPLSAEQIAKAMGEPLADVKILLDQLVAEYNRPEHGLTVKEVAGGYKMATKPEHHEAVRTFVKNLNPPLKLSLAALETLAVIAYKQPITAPEIMEVRGVQGAGVLKTLIDRKLITTAGRKNVVGKPILYKTTKEFLVQFGLRDLAELPTLKEFEDLRRMAFSEADEVLGAPENATAPAVEASSESESEA